MTDATAGTRPIYEYGEKEIELLNRQDPVLGAWIRRLGPVAREVTPDRFEALIRSLIGQQISRKAAESVFRRLAAVPGGIAPATLAVTSDEILRPCGLSARKAGWIRHLSDEVASGRLDLHALDELSDDEVVVQLQALPGVGVWTAEMFLIFAMQRPDVVSWGDLGIRRGMAALYGYEKLTRELFARHRADYSPHGTVASLYLWAASVP